MLRWCSDTRLTACLWLVVSCTGRSSGALQPVWASRRWHADPSSTWPYWATAGCWWCHSVWCWSSGWGEEWGGCLEMSEENNESVCVWGGLPEILDGQRSPEVPQDLQQDPGPVASVAQLSQVRQGLLWRANSTFQLWQLVAWERRRKSDVIAIQDRFRPLTESYEELPVASALVWRQRENTRHVISIWRFFLLENKNIIVWWNNQWYFWWLMRTSLRYILPLL